jgi:hypothetical protein
LSKDPTYCFIFLLCFIVIVGISRKSNGILLFYFTFLRFERLIRSPEFILTKLETLDKLDESSKRWVSFYRVLCNIKPTVIFVETGLRGLKESRSLSNAYASCDEEDFKHIAIIAIFVVALFCGFSYATFGRVNDFREVMQAPWVAGYAVGLSIEKEGVSLGSIIMLSNYAVLAHMVATSCIDIMLVYMMIIITLWVNSPKGFHVSQAQQTALAATVADPANNPTKDDVRRAAENTLSYALDGTKRLAFLCSDGFVYVYAKPGAYIQDAVIKFTSASKNNVAGKVKDVHKNG